MNSPSIVMLDGVENIITFDEVNTGQPTIVELSFSDGLGNITSANSQWYIMLFDESITSVNDYQNAKNKMFWASSNSNNLAASVTAALRNCSSIVAEWEISQDNNIIQLISRTLGNKTGSYPYWQRTNIPTNYCTITIRQAGSSTSQMQDGKCMLNIYNEDGGGEVGVLEKQKYSQYTDFNISPLLSTYTKYGEVSHFALHPSTVTKQGDWTEQSSIDAYMLKGYECNGSSPYLAMSGTKILWNNQHNGTPNINYLYSPTVDYSILTNSRNTNTITYALYNSAMESLYQTTSAYTPSQAAPELRDITYTFPSTAFTNAYYAEVSIGSETLMFNVIKPLLATEYWQRVYWRNEYGGIQFFDFTGAKTETFSVSNETYNVNTFDRYRKGGHVPNEKIYDAETTKQYTLTTHLFERNGKFSFDSLALAKEVWTVIGGNTYHIKPTAVQVNENDQYNNIYVATLTYSIA